MNMLSRALHALRALTGLGDTSESHLTPGHGWLLPDPVDAHGQEERDATRAQRAAAGKARA